jgi:TetR/AcrR family transcriptional regulator, transcriptional repressor for nem operon
MSRMPEFDRSVVVRRAMQVFWQRGYGQTTVTDLVRATGLQPGSLYAAFGSKKGVFVEVLDAYNRSFLERIRRMQEDGRPAFAGIRAMLEDIVEDTVSGRNRQGCLAVNALLELAEHEPDVAARLDAHNEQVRHAFAVLIARAQAEGDVPPDRRPDALAACLVNSLWGMRVMCRGAADRASLAAVVEGILDALTHR